VCTRYRRLINPPCVRVWPEMMNAAPRPEGRVVAAIVLPLMVMEGTVALGIVDMWLFDIRTVLPLASVVRASTVRDAPDPIVIAPPRVSVCPATMNPVFPDDSVLALIALPSMMSAPSPAVGPARSEECPFETMKV
jgi:hypothetical protein